jgi:hypothetical protein
VGLRGAFEAKRCNRKSPNGYTPIEKKITSTREATIRARVSFAGNPAHLLLIDEGNENAAPIIASGVEEIDPLKLFAKFNK